MGTRGAWSLENVEVKYPEGDWINYENVYLTPSETAPNTAYWAGGSYNNSQSVTNTTDKTTMSTFSTSLVPGMGASNSYNAAGTSAGSHGYIGGRYPGHNSNIHKLIYASDTISPTVSYLSGGRGYVAGTNSATAGYFCGGLKGPSSPASVSIVDRITNSTDTSERLPGCDIVAGSFQSMAACGTQDFGYLGGGGWPRQTTVSKIDYYTETNSKTPTAYLTQERTYFSATSNSTEGYWYAGYSIVGGGGATISSVEKTTFSNDTTAAIPGKMSYSANFVNSNGNTTHALVGGGYKAPGVPSSQAYNNRMDKVTYASGTISNSPSSYTSQNRRSCGTIGSRNNGAGTTYDGTKVRWYDDQIKTGNIGVWIGDTNGGGGTEIDKMDFSTDTKETVGHLSPNYPLQYSHAGSSFTNAYWINGRTTPSHWPGRNGVSWVWKFVYSTDTMNMPATSPTVGYVGASFDTPSRTIVTNMENSSPGGMALSLNHSGDTIAATPTLTNPSYKAETAGVSNAKGGVGYWTGGTSGFEGGNYYSRTSKITYATDTVANSAIADFPYQAKRMASVGGPTHGYFTKGSYDPSAWPDPTGQVSLIFKLNYSTETFTRLGSWPSGDAGNTWGSDYAGATGNTTAGYVMGGSPGDRRLCKLEYSTESTSYLPDIMPSSYESKRISAGATSQRDSNKNSSIPPAETPTSSKSPVPTPTPDTGYFSGGLSTSNTGYPSQPPYSQQHSNTDKITMASETVALAPGANLTTAKYYPVAMSTVTDAYVAGGWNNPSTPNPSSAPSATGGSIQTIDKISYATDTASRLGNLNFSSGSLWNGGGNTVKGYFVGGAGAGSGGSYPSRADKITYATDLIQGLSITGFGRRQGDVGVHENADAYGGGGVYFGRGEYSKNNGGYNHTSVQLMKTDTDTGLSIPSMDTGLPFAYAQSWSNPTHWMLFGGWTGPAYSVSPGIRSTACKVTWATETDAELPSSTGENLSGAGSAGNNTYGYAGGGRTTSPGDKRSYIMRYTFANDTFAFRPSSHLTTEKKFLAGTSAKEHANPDPYFVSTPNVI